MNTPGVSSGPPYRGQFLDVLIRGPQRGQSDLLGELGELWIGQQGDVSQQLVTRVPEDGDKPLVITCPLR